MTAATGTPRSHRSMQARGVRVWWMRVPACKTHHPLTHAIRMLPRLDRGQGKGRLGWRLCGRKREIVMAGSVRREGWVAAAKSSSSAARHPRGHTQQLFLKVPAGPRPGRLPASGAEHPGRGLPTTGGQHNGWIRTRAGRHGTAARARRQTDRVHCLEARGERCAGSVTGPE